MAKGDGWAVKRYICPNPDCGKKGCHRVSIHGTHTFARCMYCREHFTFDEFVTANPDIPYNKVEWKAK